MATHTQPGAPVNTGAFSMRKGKHVDVMILILLVFIAVQTTRTSWEVFCLRERDKRRL